MQPRKRLALLPEVGTANSAVVGPLSFAGPTLRLGLTMAACTLSGPCPLVEASTDPDGGWHPEACHPVQRVASNLCCDLLTEQSPGEESTSNDGFAPIHRSLDAASWVVARTTLPADATMLFDGCNMLIALRRTAHTRNHYRPRWNDEISLNMPIRRP